MKVLVTGGAGFIASHVVDLLVESGHQVAVVDDLSTGRRENLNTAARFHSLDIRDAQALGEALATERPDVVSHHAAQVAINRSVEDPAADAHRNIIGTINVLEQSRVHGVERVVFASSGGALYGQPRVPVCAEDHPVAPLSPYGASKAAAETYLRVYRHVHGIDSVSLRYGNVYGPRQDPHGEAGVVAIFASRMLRGEPCVIYGSGEQERDFVHVSDVARANLLALEGEPGAYNIGTGAGTTVNTIFFELAKLLDYRLEPTYAEAKPGEVYRIALDCSRAAEGLTWRSRVSLDAGLRTVADSVRGDAT